MTVSSLSWYPCFLFAVALATSSAITVAPGGKAWASVETATWRALSVLSAAVAVAIPLLRTPQPKWLMRVFQGFAVLATLVVLMMVGGRLQIALRSWLHLDEVTIANNFPRTGKKARPKNAVRGKRFHCAKCRKRSPRPVKTPAPWYCPACQQETAASPRGIEASEGPDAHLSRNKR